MIEIDGCDDCAIRVEDVDGIEPAAQTDLQYQGIGTRVVENQRRGERAELEISKRRIETRLLDALERLNDGRIVDFERIDADPLVVAQ